MPGLDPGIHAFLAMFQDVYGRVKPGHDGSAPVNSPDNANYLRIFAGQTGMPSRLA
jgi:hypothetical protein